MNLRIKKLASLFERHRIDAFVVTKDANITYLTGFPASESWLLITPQKAFYITDFRYLLEAKKGLRGITIERYERSLFTAAVELALSKKVAKLGFDSRHLSLAGFHELRKACRNRIQPVEVNNLVESLREIKTAEEISRIKKAIRLNLKVHDFLAKLIRPKLTEQEVKRRLEECVKDHGAGFSFDPIIASGPNSCLPHAKVSDRKIENNEVVLLDVGIDIDGYKSDLTRMVFLGKIARPIYDICEIVREAQNRAIRKIKPKATAGEIDYEARNYFKEHKLDKFFGHSLGHGVGLEIHEGPKISPKSPAILQEGMVFTVEPAIYIPNQFGIRLEDMILVTRKGYEILSRNNS